MSWNTTWPLSTARLSNTSAGNVLRRQVDALAARLFEHRGEQAHLELESQHINARRAALPALGDHLLDEQACPKGRLIGPMTTSRPLRAPWKKPSCACGACAFKSCGAEPRGVAL
jgi:hypothetical protein